MLTVEGVCCNTVGEPVELFRAVSVGILAEPA